MHIDELDDIVNGYNTVKIKHVDINSSTYINFGIEYNKKDPKFKIGDHVLISKYKNIFAKGYTVNRPEEVFVIKKVKSTAPWTYVKENVNGEEIFGKFCKKEL